jgi:hypothetical protein
MTVSRICKNRFDGNESGICSLLALRKSHMEETPVAVSMLVYMEAASAENSSAPGGICISLRSLMTSVEFWMGDLMRGSSV